MRRFAQGGHPDIFGSDPVTSATIHPTVIASEAIALSRVASASADDLDKQHELEQFLTPNAVAEFMASLFEIHRGEVRLPDAGAGAGQFTPAFVI